MMSDEPDLKPGVNAESDALRRALEAGEARFRNIIEKNADGVLVVNQRGDILFVNPAAEGLLCRQASELIGSNFGIPIIPGDTTELDLPCVEGDSLVVEMRIVPTEWDGGPAYLVSLRDVTDRVRSEESVRSAEERYRFISEAISDFTFSFRVEPDGRLTLEWLTDAFHRVTGFSAVEALARGWAQLIHPDDLFLFEEHLQRILDGHNDTCELRIITGAGETRWLRNSVRSVRDPANDRPHRIYGAGQDITERRLLEIELRQRIEELAELDRRKDEFLAMLAHELRNPLAPMRNAVRVLQNVEDRQACDQMRTIIGHQVDHLTRLVDDLLDVTRITRGMIQLRPARTDLAAVLDHAVEPLRALFEERRLNLSVSICPGPHCLIADPARLQQVFANLLNNAMKYTDPGGSVHVELGRDGPNLIVNIRDSGIGLAPEMLTRVFEPFSQADRSLDRSQGGLGIGLTLAHRLVAMHDGELTARSPGLDLGSEFIVRLPALIEGSPEGEPPAEDRATKTLCRQPEADGQARPILVVDDNVDAAGSLALILGLWGHCAHVVHDGPEAIEAARRIKPRIVLLDIGLPKLDGYQVARALRQEPSLDGLRIVAMTGYGQDEDRRRTREAGFDLHLVKPLDLQELEAILSNRA